MADINDLARDFTPEERERNAARTRAFFRNTLRAGIAETLRETADKVERGQDLTADEQELFRDSASLVVHMDPDHYWLPAASWARFLCVEPQSIDAFRKRLDRVRSESGREGNGVVWRKDEQRANGILFSWFAVDPIAKSFQRPFLPPKIGD